MQSKGSLINVVAKEGGNSARETSSYPKHSYKKNRNYSFVIVGQITKLFLEAMLEEKENLVVLLMENVTSISSPVEK